MRTKTTPRLVVPFMDLSWQWRQIRTELKPRLEQLFAASAFCLGPYVEEFEREFAAWLGARHVVAVGSGTAALHLAMIVADIGPGDEVLVPANTFIATAWGIIHAGARPIFCDVDPETGNIDISDASRRVNNRVRAIIPVHLFGKPADLDSVEALARAYDLVMIEDAAQAHGAQCAGRKVGTFGVVGCFSFHPGKNLGAAGEAGAIATDDPSLAARLAALRSHGEVQRYIHDEIGFNYRMDGIQGLILTHKLRQLDEWTRMRRTLAQAYLEGLADLPLKLPVASCDHVYHRFVVRTPYRAELREQLQAQGIQTGIHYPIPLHRQPCFDHIPCERNCLPMAEAWAKECLSLPLFPGMTAEQIEHTISAIRTFFDVRKIRAYSL